MSSALAGETVPGAGGAADNVLNALRKAGGAPPNRLVAAHPRSIKTKRVESEEDAGPPGAPSTSQTPVEAAMPPGPGEVQSYKPAFQKTEPDKFIAAQKDMKRSPFLTQLQPHEIKQHKLFTNKEGNSGVAVDPHGDVQNVFNNKGPKGSGAHAVAHAIENGGRTLDAFDDFLPGYYSQFGFKESGRMKFNREYAPEGWDYEKHKEPDVVFMHWAGYPEGGKEAAIARATGKAKAIKHEQTTKYYDDWERGKEASRTLARGAEANQMAGGRAGPEARPARNQPSSGPSKGSRGTVEAPGPGEKLPKAPAVTSQPPQVSKDVIKRLGPRPSNPDQAAIYDRIATRMGKGKEFDEGIPLVPARKDNGDFKTESDKETPLYEKHHYDVVHSPMLGKKALQRNEKGSVEVPDVEDTIGDEFKYLGPVDRKRLSHLVANGAVDAFADKLHNEFQSVKGDPKVMAAKGWYTQAAKDLIKHFGEHADLFAQLLAATSPQQGVVQNFKDALEAYNRFRRGDFDQHIKLYRQAHQLHSEGKLVQHLLDSGIGQQMVDAGKIKKMPTTGAEAMAAWIKHHNLVPTKSDNKTKYGLNSDKVMKVLASTWLATSEGPKTRNYTGNLSGKTIQATIDMWAARTMRRLGYEGHSKEPWLIHPAQEQAVKNLDFAFSQLAFRKAAEKAGLTPHDLQAILWYKEQYDWVKSGKAKGDPAEKDYRPLLEAYQPTHARATEAHHWEPGMPIEVGLGGRS